MQISLKKRKTQLYVDIFNKFQNEEVQKYEDYMKDVFDIESYLK